jgi:hypothetical protein
MELPRFTVLGWSPESAGGYGTSSSGQRWSDGSVYRDALGRLLEVEVVPPDAAVSEQKQRAVFNMGVPPPEPVPAAGIHPPEVEATQEAAGTATLGWVSESVSVDGVPTWFQTLDLGSELWVAVAPLADCVLILRSHGVSRSDVALVRATR